MECSECGVLLNEVSVSGLCETCFIERCSKFRSAPPFSVFSL